MGIFNFLKSNSEHRKSIRVNTNIGDKYININLGQTYESMDILSLKIFQKDLYRLFDADYGIIVGRVLGQGVGIPNAKVSVFIPLDEEDITSPTTLEDIKKIEATALYPFQTVFDKDGNGKVYNLLPKYARNRNVNGFPDNPYGIGATPKTPVGTFPEKDEILVNETVAYVYDKYLKFTTVTNESGDYILTVPANKSYNVNMSCDITDIGRFSTCAALLKLDGYPDNFFSEDGRTLNEEIELERLPNIDIQNNSITVKPLWSQNISNSNVGINRLDFNLVKKIKPFVTIIGNQFTQNSRAWWGDKVQFRFIIGIRALCFTVANVNVRIPGILPFFRLNVFARKMCTLNGGKGDYEPFEMKTINAYNECDKEAAESILTEGLSDDIFISSHVKGDLDIKLFNIKNTVPESDAQILNEEAKSIANNDPIFNNYSYNTDIELYDKNKYIYYQNQGSFLFLINCNRNKVITNENGDLIPVDDKSEKGVFTSFRGYFYVTNLSDVDNPPTRYRVGKVRLKVPQLFDYAQTNKWIWKHFKFDFGKIYSVAQNTKVRYSEMTTDKESVDDYTLPDDPNPPEGFATQTNLFLFGEREIGDSEPIPSFVENHNTGYTSYVNSYNHIVSLGTDTANLNSSEIITNTNQDSQTAPPPQFNFKFALGDNLPVDDLQQPPIVLTTQRFGSTSVGYSYSPTSFYFSQINLDIFLNPTNIPIDTWRIINIEVLKERVFGSLAYEAVKFQSYSSTPNVLLSYRFESTSSSFELQGISMSPPEFTPTISPTSYKIVNPISNPTYNPQDIFLLENRIFDALLESLKLNTSSDFIDDGYYLFKLTLRSINAANVAATNREKNQYFYIKVE
jgi:hypothetical protein